MVPPDVLTSLDKQICLGNRLQVSRNLRKEGFSSDPNGKEVGKDVLSFYKAGSSAKFWHSKLCWNNLKEEWGFADCLLAIRFNMDHIILWVCGGGQKFGWVGGPLELSVLSICFYWTVWGFTWVVSCLVKVFILLSVKFKWQKNKGHLSCNFFPGCRILLAVLADYIT